MAQIVVIDDDQVILDLLRTVLTDAGHETVLASGPETLPTKANADLIITDLVPLKAYQRAAALGWIAALRSRFRGAPVFVLTAHREAATETDMLGANAIFVKPFDVDRLLAKVDELIA